MPDAVVAGGGEVAIVLDDGFVGGDIAGAQTAVQPSALLAPLPRAIIFPTWEK